jgi:hypothetical protein
VLKSISLALISVLLLASFAVAAPLTSANEFLAKVNSDENAGILSAEEALMIKFYHVFENTKVPAEYQVEGFAPLKCATPLIQQFEEMRTSMSRSSVQEVEEFLTIEPARSTYISPDGNFTLTYSTIGGDAVPSADVDPANGIPDFVEKIATYFDTSWQVEVVDHRFQAPPIGAGTYAVSFQAQAGTYGYTTVVNYSLGSTRIVMHNTFQGFPPNDDPDGNVLGAAKVTAAHEFKHATQFATSRWSEGGWNEVDATWAEDLVFDVVNDFYNYLPGDSPIKHPELSLDYGGTGSYEDCVWQTWMAETWGVDFITDYWEWRRSHSGQSVMDSFEAILDSYGSTLAEGWAHFTAWNYGTGYRAIPGVGYGEAADFPYGNFLSYTTSYPFSYSGSVEHLAANTFRLLGFSGDIDGTLDIDFDGADSGGPMTLSLHIKKQDGTGVIETIELDGNNDAISSLQTPLQDIYMVGFVVGNAAKSGLSLPYSFTVTQYEAPPVPAIELDSANISVSLEAGQTTDEYIGITNSGEAESVLNYEVKVWGNSPVDAPGAKNISGSTLTSDITSFLPGTTFDLEVTVYNGATDVEWLTGVTMDFPAGVTVNSSTDFVGGTYGPMISNHNDGDGAEVIWHGVANGQGYGVVVPDQSAHTTISLTVDPTFSGDLEIPSTIVGDGRGAAPHILSPTVVLTQADPEIAVTFPNGGEEFYVDDDVTITWDTFGGVEFVDVSVSVDGGDNWEVLVADLANTGSFAATVGGPGSIHALVRITDSNGIADDVSDAQFSIIEPVEWLVVNPESGSLDQGQSETLTLSFDSTGLSTNTYNAWVVIAHDGSGNSGVVPVTMDVSGDLSGVDTPLVFALNGNYPNPFNPMTKISFSLPKEAHTSVQVLDVRGRVVRTLFVGTMAEGDQQLNWDGKGDDGHSVSAGLYLARLRTVGYEATVKMTLAK